MKGFLCVIFCLLSPIIFAQGNTYNLTVKVTNIAVKKGILELGLYHDPSNFAQVGKTYRMVRVKVDEHEETVTFYNLPKGKYAVCIYLDENSNNQCDKNFLGIPTEKFAFSNNVRPLLSLPSFESCSLSLHENKTIFIRVDQ